MKIKGNKALVVSSIPFSRSNRGIDIVTQTLALMGFQVTHLVYAPKRSLKSFSYPREKELPICQEYLPFGPIGYYERFMSSWPVWLVRRINAMSIYKLQFDFSAYDLIVIESGKPVLLAPCLPDDTLVVYRQSDPMFTAYKNDAMLEAERVLMERADRILSVRDMSRLYDGYREFKSKTDIIVNGFDVLNNSDNVQQNNENANQFETNAIYIGYTPIDGELLLELARNNKDTAFHIVGQCIGKPQINECESQKNIFIYGNLSSRDYMPLAKECDIGIIPYVKDGLSKYIGMNSKYLLFMSMGMPIISRSVGFQDEFPNNENIIFCESNEEFIRAFETLKLKGAQKVAYDIDFAKYSKAGRIDEYKSYFTQLLEDTMQGESNG